MKQLVGVVFGAIALAGLGLSVEPASAQSIKIAVGQKGGWDTSVPDVGQRGGIFKRHGIEMDILYTEGAGETLQAVIADSVEIGVAASTVAVMGAFQKNAPIRIIGPEATGSVLFFYVRSDSKIKSLKDAGPDTTMAYATPGSSSVVSVQNLMALYGVKLKPVATGGAAGTFTQVMSGQIDIGWGIPPFGLDALAQNKIRIITQASEVEAIRNQTVRVNIVNARRLNANKDLVRRFMAAYRETVDWLYASDDALKTYAEVAGISFEQAKQVRDGFYVKSIVQQDEIKGLDTSMQEGLKFKNLAMPLTDAQLKELIQMPPRS